MVDGSTLRCDGRSRGPWIRNTLDGKDARDRLRTIMSIAAGCFVGSIVLRAVSGRGLGLFVVAGTLASGRCAAPPSHILVVLKCDPLRI